MPRSLRPPSANPFIASRIMASRIMASRILAGLLLAAGPGGPLAARAADLPFAAAPVPSYGTGGFGVAVQGGGGFRVARIPVRPVPVHYDIYGYPLFPGPPAPLAVGNGCPPALQPSFDSEGNLAGYAPIPMCR